MEIILSKTNYILFRECPKNAWYKIHKPDLYYESELSEFEKGIIETGNEVDQLARGLFSAGALIEGRDEQAQQTTKDYMDKKSSILFQPIFVEEGFLAALDILQFNPDSKSYSIYEVKGKNSIDDKIYYHDLAFQVNLLKKLGYKIQSASIIHLNSEYVRAGELDITKLLKSEDVTSEVEGLLGSVMGEMEEALEYLSAKSEPKGDCPCIYKGRSNHCSTFKYSNPQIPEYSVHDIARIGSSKAKLREMIDGKFFNLQDIPEHIKLSDIQKNQVTAHVSKKITINKEEISKDFKNLSFPLYFLDYETFPCGIPRFDGFKPYQQIPFQYSLHILKSPDAELEQKEFLHVESTDPSKTLATSLRENIGDVGSIIVWNKRFECKINEDLGKRISSIASFIDSINSRTYDLMDIFSKQHYVHKDFRGSTSIKVVLPVLAPELTYKDLEIQEGGAASQVWNKIVTDQLSASERQKSSDDLRKYCKRDTYAMYVIWKHLHDLTQEKV